jgi:hypothetical protein
MSSNSGVRRRLAAIVVLAALTLFAAPPWSYGDEPPPPPPVPTPVPGPNRPGPKIGINGTECWEKGSQPSVHVYLSEVAKDPITIVFDTADGTAVAPDDYAAIKGRIVTIPAGSSGVDVALDIVADGITEPDERFTVSISKPSIGEIDKGTATVIIHDGGRPPAGQ